MQIRENFLEGSWYHGCQFSSSAAACTSTGSFKEIIVLQADEAWVVVKSDDQEVDGMRTGRGWMREKVER